MAGVALHAQNHGVTIQAGPDAGQRRRSSEKRSPRTDSFPPRKGRRRRHESARRQRSRDPPSSCIDRRACTALATGGARRGARASRSRPAAR
jgi:hypothetical protein